MLQDDLNTLAEFADAVRDLYWNRFYPGASLTQEAVKRARESVLWILEHLDCFLGADVRGADLRMYADEAMRAPAISGLEHVEPKVDEARCAQIAQRTLNDQLTPEDFDYLDFISELLTRRVVAEIDERPAAV